MKPIFKFLFVFFFRVNDKELGANLNSASNGLFEFWKRPKLVHMNILSQHSKDQWEEEYANHFWATEL